MKSLPKWGKPVLFSLLGILLVTGVVFGSRLASSWNKPLGPSLSLPTLPFTEAPTLPAATKTPQAVSRVSSPGADTPSPAPVSEAAPTIEPTSARTPLCGGPPTMVILGVGTDSRANDYTYGLADVIRVARIDFVTPKVTVLSLSRDIWVEIPWIKDYRSNTFEIDHAKLNQAYFYDTPGMNWSAETSSGSELLARTLDLNFGLRADHYGVVNMITFSKIVDAVGGIDIYLENDVDGRPIDEKTEDMGYFNAGQQHLNGSQALRLSRIRKKYNDITRGDNQTLVLCALKEKITSPSVITKIPQIISAFQGAVQTDLSPAQLTQLACLAPQLKPENLIFTGLPEELLQPARAFDPYLNNLTFIFDADFEAIRDLTTRFMQGTWPTEPDEPSCP